LRKIVKKQKTTKPKNLLKFYF